MRTIIVLLVPVLCTLGVAFAGEPSAGKPQAICPVMGNPIDKQIHVDYQGKRVYFCCADCPGIFKNDPDKYMEKMKAEGVVLEDAPAGSTAEKDDGEGLGELAKPLGITTISFLALTATAGATMRRKPRVLRKVHIGLAITTVSLAAIHAVLVIFFLA